MPALRYPPEGRPWGRRPAIFEGEVLEHFDFSQVRVLDRDWTRTLGIVDDDGNLIWLCEVDGRRAIFKVGGNWHRSQRTQLLCDELKPLFGVPKIGCSMVQGPSGTWGVLMRFRGDGRNLMAVPRQEWLGNPIVRRQLVKTAVYDLVIGNNNRLKRNYLWLSAHEGILPIDEEKGLDFEGLVTFRMDQECRRALWDSLREFPLAAHCAALRAALTPACLEGLAARMFWPEHARLIAAGLGRNLRELEAEVFRYVGSKYADGKALGVGTKKSRGPQRWDGY